MGEPSYAEQLAKEADLWSRAAREQARTVVPEWHNHRAFRPNAIVHASDIDALLSLVRPGMRILEVGCGAGWLSLAMARRGAIVDGIDIAEGAIAVARSHYESIRDGVSGSLTHHLADLNSIDLPSATYDVVAAKGILHHLPEPERLVDQVHRSLVPGGLFWIPDTHGEEAISTVLVTGLLMLVLPTDPTYVAKIRGLLRFGVRVPGRLKLSMEAHGATPFEGIGRGHDWPGLVGRRFIEEQRLDHPALTGYLAACLRMPDRLALPILRVIRAVDTGLVRRRLIRSTGVTIYARKPGSSGGR